MAKYKMKSTQNGVRKGEVHPVTFEEGKTYEIGDELAGQWEKEGFIEASSGDAVDPVPTHPDLHEGWLDTNTAVLRHGELTAAEVIARDKSPYSDGMQPAEQVVGKAEGEEHADESGDQPEDGTASTKKKSK